MQLFSQPTIRQTVRRCLMAATIFALSAVCLAQNCALCYTQAASSGSRIIQGLRSGILILVIPPMFMSVGITILAYKKRNQFHRSQQNRDPRDW